MTNDDRTTVYLRERSTLTPAQRRRVAKHDHRAQRDVQVRTGRIRRAFLSREAKRLRREGAHLVAVVRGGHLRPSTRREAARARRDAA